MKMPGWLRRILVAVKNKFIEKTVEEAVKGVAKNLPKDEESK